MLINPTGLKLDLKTINSLSQGLEKISPESGEQNGLGFKDIFQDVIDNVVKTEAATKVDAYNLSIGNMDDLHTMTINAAKADVALQTMVQLRNKILDAYSEVMRTNL